MFILICLVCFDALYAKSKNVETTDNLPVLEIVNTELQAIVDSLLEHEKNMDYYNSNLVFYINVQHQEDLILLSIGSTDKKMKLGNEIGCITIKKHIFIVSGYYETNLFKKTKRKKRYNFYVPMEQQTKNNCKDKIEIDVFEDDSYTQLNYWLVNGKLIKIQ